MGPLNPLNQKIQSSSVWAFKKKKCQKCDQNFDPSKPSKSKDTAVLSWCMFQKKLILSKMFQKCGQNFDPSKPSISKDRAVLSWKNKKKKNNFVEHVSKIWSKL